MATSLNTGLVALVRSSLGIDPTESLVLAFRKGDHVLGTMRIELANPSAVAQWVTALEEVIANLTDSEQLDGTFLIAFDDHDILRGDGYRAVAILLARYGIPVNHAVLVAEGKVMDYFGEGENAVDYEEVLKEDIALEAMVSDRKRQLAQDITACTESNATVMATAVQRMAQIAGMKHENIADASADVAHGLALTIADYAENGAITDEIAGWIAGTFTSKVGRDLAVAGLAGIVTTDQDLREIFLGQRPIEDRNIFETGATMLHESLAHIAGETPRANIICTLGWAHWMTGNMPEAMAMLRKANEEEPGHSLANSLRKVMLNIGIPKSAFGK